MSFRTDYLHSNEAAFCMSEEADDGASFVCRTKFTCRVELLLREVFSLSMLLCLISMTQSVVPSSQEDDLQ
jgi:hypothetical protein